MTMRYPAVVPKEGKNLLADFPTCPGCHTFAPQGRDIEHEAKEALELWLESHRKERILPPRPPRTLKARKGTMLWVPVEPKLAVARTALDARGARPDPGRAREARRRQPARDRPAREPGLQPDDRHAQPRCPGHGSRDRFPLVRGRVRKVVRQAAPSPRAWSGARTRDRRNARPPSWQTFASVAYAVEPPKTVSDILSVPASTWTRVPPGVPPRVPVKQGTGVAPWRAAREARKTSQVVESTGPDRPLLRLTAR